MLPVARWVAAGFWLPLAVFVVWCAALLQWQRHLASAATCDVDAEVRATLERTNREECESDEQLQAAPACRICMDGLDDSDIPLISPCLCRGSLRYVHAGCLNRWRAVRARHSLVCRSGADLT